MEHKQICICCNHPCHHSHHHQHFHNTLDAHNTARRLNSSCFSTLSSSYQHNTHWCFCEENLSLFIVWRCMFCSKPKQSNERTRYTDRYFSHVTVGMNKTYRTYSSDYCVLKWQPDSIYPYTSVIVWTTSSYACVYRQCLEGRRYTTTS